MPIFHHDGVDFNYVERGAGAPFFFQHGLGGDVTQPLGLFAPPEGVRLLAFDCRAHGATHPLGDEGKLSISVFADDLQMLMDRLELPQAVIGGISMGAAVALNFALRRPERVLGLVLSRPAWLDKPNPGNLQIYSLIASLIREHGAQRGLHRFQESAAYRAVLRESPDVAQSLIGQFTHPRAEEAVARLERIPRDAPSHDRRQWRTIVAPTLVLANRQDPVHSFEYGETISHAIPNATFRELTPKSVSVERHAADVQSSVEGFLRSHILT